MPVSPTWGLLVRFWPLLAVSGYLGGTIIVFAFGPIDYPVTNPGATYGFLLGAHAALAVGYFLVPFRPPGPPLEGDDAWILWVRRLIVISALLNVVLLVPWTLFMTGGSFDLLGALRDPAGAYRRTRAIAEATTNPVTYALMVAGPITALSVPLTLFYWPVVGRRERVFGCVAIGAIAASAFLVGRNKGPAELTLLLLVFALVHAFRQAEPWKPSRWALSIGAMLLISALFFGYFVAGTVGRGARLEEGYVGSVDGYLDFDNALLKPFPESLRPGVGLFYSYLGQGYYGLSLSLRLDFVWTRGLGNSLFLHMAEERFLGTEFARTNAYPARVEEAFGYRMLSLWHTIYPWLASDLTFPGTLIFVAVIGALLAVTWFEMLTGTNPFSVAMFANLVLMLFYFNANNQVLGFPVQFSTTVGTLALWLWSRRRAVFRGDGGGRGPEPHEVE